MNSQQQWQLIVIQKIETASNWLGTPSRKKKVNIFIGVFFGTMLLWGMFFVPSTILKESADAQNLVDLTASIFPWIDMTQVNYGTAADKFVYLQSVSVWVLILPNLVSCISNSKLRLNKKVMGKEFYSTALIAIPAGILLFIFVVVLPNWFHSDTYIPKAQGLFILNKYFCAAGAISTAWLFDFILIGMIITTLYLIHFFRNFQKFFKY